MIKAYVEKKDHLNFSLATDGKECFLIVVGNARITIPDNLAEALLFHINLAAGSELKCFYDGKEPRNSLKDLAELEEIAAAQEQAVETLRGENETLLATIDTQNNAYQDIERALEEEKEKNLKISNELGRHKKLPEHTEVVESS